MKKEEGEEERTVKKETKGRDEIREGGERRGRNIDMKLGQKSQGGKREQGARRKSVQTFVEEKKKERAEELRGEGEDEKEKMIKEEKR